MEYAVIVPVVVVIVLLGIYPKPVLDRVQPAACRSTAAVQSAVHPIAGPGVTHVSAPNCSVGVGQVWFGVTHEGS